MEAAELAEALLLVKEAEAKEVIEKEMPAAEMEQKKREETKHQQEEANKDNENQAAAEKRRWSKTSTTEDLIEVFRVTKLRQYSDMIEKNELNGETLKDLMDLHKFEALGICNVIHISKIRARFSADLPAVPKQTAQEDLPHELICPITERFACT